MVNYLGRDGGQVVSVLAINSDDPSSTPAKVDSLFSVKLYEKNKKEVGNGQFKN